MEILTKPISIKNNRENWVDQKYKQPWTPRITHLAQSNKNLAPKTIRFQTNKINIKKWILNSLNTQIIKIPNKYALIKATRNIK